MTGHSRVNVLMVDDRRENLMALDAILGDLDANLVEASSGPEALKKLLQQDFAVILLDVQMPGMDGFETAQLIRARDRSRLTPIIFVTAYEIGEGKVHRGYAVGASDYLFKPVVPEVLRSKVTVFVDLFRKTEEIKRQAEELQVARQRAHKQELAAEAKRWEAQLLRTEMETEKRFIQQLEANYQRLKELEQLRDDLIGMLVHDLRTPLTSFLTGLQTMEAVGDLNADQREILEISLAGGHTLMGMINDLLDIQKMEDGSIKLDCRPIEPAALLDQALAQVRGLVKEKNLWLVLDAAPDLPLISVDEEMVRRALVNLLGNAVKFTPPGGTITASIQPEEKGEGIVFCIRDTGEGIPSEAFNRIFEKFGQVETRKSGRKMSTGLGLTFCRMVVEAHKGKIWVESEPGQGSAFPFVLPPQCA